MLEKLKKATPMELEIWMLGAGILGFGLGASLAGYAQQYSPWIILLGIILHGWGMYRIYSAK
jgi:hypothetical protein